jgi:hypothetical protein
MASESHGNGGTAESKGAELTTSIQRGGLTFALDGAYTDAT